MTENRAFPETDLTKFALRTKSAPLSRTGTHEIVATAEYQNQLIGYARIQYGPAWRRTYEIVPRS